MRKLEKMTPEQETNLQAWIDLLNGDYKQCFGTMKLLNRPHNSGEFGYEEGPFYCPIGLFLDHKAHVIHSVADALVEVAKMTGLSTMEVGNIMEQNDGGHIAFSKLATQLEYILNERKKHASV
jgi:hypothetical protein